jgi:peptidoglycan/LPS O-acetylase OafA/YrhL
MVEFPTQDVDTETMEQSEMTPVARPTRLDSLTGMRFVAAFFVLVCHSYIVTHDTSMITYGRASVSFFFVLSGFVLGWSNIGLTTRNFYRRRVARIYPVWVATWLLGSALVLFVGPRMIPASWPATHLSLGPSLASLFLVQSWVPSTTWAQAINLPQGWSLSCEAFFYLTFPLAAAWLARRTLVSRRIVAGGCVVWTVVCTVVANMHPGFGMVVYVFPPIRLPEFLLGIVIALEVRDGLRVPWWPGLVTAVPSAIASWLIGRHGGAPDQGVTVIPVVLLIAAAATSDLRARWTPLRARPMVVLGAWSYALYLVHTSVYLLVNATMARFEILKLQTSGGPWWLYLHPFVFLPFAMLLAIFVAREAYHYVEEPGERHWRGASRRVELVGVRA